MKVRGVPVKDSTVKIPDRPAASFKLHLALKAVEFYLGSCRPVVVRSRCAEKLLRPDSQYKPVVALWHSSLIYTLYHFRVYHGAVMTSPSKDGEWVAAAVSMWGSYPVRGSTLKGGLKAVRLMSELMRGYGFASGIVADGSKGPANVAQIGAVILARDAGRPIIPTGFAASPALYFNSWDRMVLPLPFSRVSIVYGEMFTVPADTRGSMVEYYRKRLEDSLNAATAQARRMVGLEVEDEGVGCPGKTRTGYCT